MQVTRSQRLAIGAATLAAVAVLVVSTLTLTSSSAQTPTPAAGANGDGQSFIDRHIERFAGHLGVTADRVREALKLTAKDGVQDAVDAGKLTPEQAAELNAKIDSGEGRGLFFHGGRKFAGPSMHLGGDALADAIGIDRTTLREALASGQTLRQVIETNGKTPDEVINAVVEAHRARFSDAVASGKLTQAQLDELLSSLREGLAGSLDSAGGTGFPRLHLGDRGERFGLFRGADRGSRS